MSDCPAVRFTHVTKYFRRENLLSAGLKNLLLSLPHHITKAAHPGFFRALDDISFDIAHGECVGVIGRNGSGKSTTLGLIAEVLKPNNGSVEISGHVCPLLELGAGFHPDLSGAENIFLNGVLLGMTRREVKSKFEEIVAFSELEEFLDRPLRTYSSGMMARLGFSVAVHLDPEILLVDEILSVGDLSFSQKCLKKMRGFRAQGVTIIFVSHSPEAVTSLCDRAIWLDQGKLFMSGDARAVCDEYQKAMSC